MPYGFQRGIEEHAGAGVAHYGADAGAHFGFVAVGRALLAEAFVVSIFAHVEPHVGVCLKLAAVGTKFAPLILLFASAVYPYHQGHCALLPVYSIIFIQLPIQTFCANTQPPQCRQGAIPLHQDFVPTAIGPPYAPSILFVPL